MYYGLVPNTPEIIANTMNQWLELLTSLFSTEFSEMVPYAESLVHTYLDDIMHQYPLTERYGGISLWFARSLNAQLSLLFATAFPKIHTTRLIPGLLPECHSITADDSKILAYAMLYTSQRVLPHPDLCLLPTLSEIRDAAPVISPTFPLNSQEVKPQILYYRRQINELEYEFAFKLHIPPLFVNLMAGFSAMIPTPLGPRFFAAPELCRGVSYRTRLHPRSLLYPFDFSSHSYISLDQYVNNSADYLRPLFLCPFPKNYWNVSYILTSHENFTRTKKTKYTLKIRLTTQAEVGLVYIDSCTVTSIYFISSGEHTDTKLTFRPNLIHRSSTSVSIVQLTFYSRYQITTDMLSPTITGWCLFESVDLGT